MVACPIACGRLSGRLPLAVKTAGPLLVAGATFAGSALLGILLGVVVAGRSGNQLWVLAGLALGIGFGGYAAVRALMRSI